MQFQCSKSCGEGGFRVRKVECYHNKNKSVKCKADAKPIDREMCNLSACDKNATPGKNDTIKSQKNFLL